MSARRCLFGRPTPEQRANTRSWLDMALKKRLREQSEKWGFDFELGVPMPDSQEYDYQVIPGSSVPQFYRTKLLTVSTSTSSLDLSSTTLTPLSSPSTSDKDASLLADSSFEEEENNANWKFAEPTTSRKSPTKRQQKLTDYMPVKKSPNTVTTSPKSESLYKNRRVKSSRASPYARSQ